MHCSVGMPITNHNASKHSTSVNNTAAAGRALHEHNAESARSQQPSRPTKRCKPISAAGFAYRAAGLQCGLSLTSRHCICRALHSVYLALKKPDKLVLAPLVLALNVDAASVQPALLSNTYHCALA
eukprot:356731-Chlamydomonas_euryale.AAC.13